MINNVIWKPISGYEELYLVSNEGQVFSLISNKLLKQSNTTTGYKKVELTKQRRKKSLKVHRIVAKEFLANPLNMPIVNHLDGNPKNNDSTNLEWCDQKRNMQHAYDTGLIYSRLHRYKKELIEEYENSEISLSKLSEKYKVSIKSLGKMIKENGISIRTSSELRNIYKIDRAKLADMIESGKSNSEIATFFGTNKKLIATYRCKYTMYTIGKWTTSGSGTSCKAQYMGADGNLVTRFDEKFQANNEDTQNPFNIRQGSFDFAKQGDNLRFYFFGRYSDAYAPHLASVKCHKVYIVEADVFGRKDNDYITHNALKRFIFQKNNVDSWDDIPNRYAAGSELVVYTENSSIYFNGQPAINQAVNPPVFSPLKPGLNKIEFHQSNWILEPPTVTVEWKERYL